MSSSGAQRLPTVLVVEDEVLIRMSISDYLRDCQYRVIECVNADEALVVLAEADVQIDVVFTDVNMPGTLDGFGLARWVRQNMHGLKVIIAGTVSRAADAAADLCEDGPTLAKPYEPAAVVDRIKRLIASADANEPR